MTKLRPRSFDHHVMPSFPALPAGFPRGGRWKGRGEGLFPTPNSRAVLRLKQSGLGPYHLYARDPDESASPRRSVSREFNAVNVVIVAEHASTRFGGEAI